MLRSGGWRTSAFCKSSDVGLPSCCARREEESVSTCDSSARVYAQGPYLLLVVELCVPNTCCSARAKAELRPATHHHLFHHGASLRIEVAQLRVLGLDLGRVDPGRARDDVRPPCLLVLLLELDRHLFRVLCRRESRRQCTVLDTVRA